jgi:hypothetical protein
MRAARYDVQEIMVELNRIRSKGGEVGVHGIDAWSDVAKARLELEAVADLTDRDRVGVRMHWLFLDNESFSILDEAGFAYDSSFGYNRTIGYRAGTTQVYKPLSARTLLELPLHVMDTALFYPSYMNASANEAAYFTRALIENATHLGGVVTVNWHDRSIAPERLWGDSYIELLARLNEAGAWFATAAQAVAWFQKRRSTVFTESNLADGFVNTCVQTASSDDLPALKIRAYNLCGRQTRVPDHNAAASIQDLALASSADLQWRSH